MPIKIRIKNLINIAWDVIETSLYAMKIKRKIMEIKDSFLNPFQNFLCISINFNYITSNINQIFIPYFDWYFIKLLYSKNAWE